MLRRILKLLAAAFLLLNHNCEEFFVNQELNQE